MLTLITDKNLFIAINAKESPYTEFLPVFERRHGFTYFFHRDKFFFDILVQGAFI